MSYALSVTLDAGFDEAVDRTKAALAEQGFGVLTVVDLRQVLMDKLDAVIPQQILMGACRPDLAYQAVQVEPSVGLLLPCTVTVQEITEQRTQVQILDPSVMIGLTNNAALLPMIEDAGRRLSMVLASLGEHPDTADQSADDHSTAPTSVN